jgi:hypothetical protein
MNESSEYHKHKCKFCAYVWQHHNINDVSHNDLGAHECPSCHRCNWGLGIYTGPLSPMVCNGTRPESITLDVNIHPDQNKYFS